MAVIQSQYSNTSGKLNENIYIYEIELLSFIFFFLPCEQSGPEYPGSQKHLSGCTHTPFTHPGSQIASTQPSPDHPVSQLQIGITVVSLQIPCRQTRKKMRKSKFLDQIHIGFGIIVRIHLVFKELFFELL